ncbi:hypothetical protein BH24ACT4_BH24ACT4_23130 [soil metagenome]
MTGAPTDADARAEEAASDLDVEAGPDIEEEDEEEVVGKEQVASRSDLDMSRV